METVTNKLTAVSRLLEQAMNDIHALDSEVQETLAQTDEAAAIALERQIASAVERVRAEYERSAGPSEAVKAEIVRVEAMIHQIRQIVENPTTDLSIVIRKNVERAELESYLKGLRFTEASK